MQQQPKKPYYVRDDPDRQPKQKKRAKSFTLDIYEDPREDRSDILVFRCRPLKEGTVEFRYKGFQGTNIIYPLYAEFRYCYYKKKKISLKD